MTNTNKEGLNIIIFYIVMWIAVIILQFIMIYMNLEPSGEVVITDAEELRMISVTNGKIEVATQLVLWFSALSTSFINSIPYTATMISVIESFGDTLHGDIDPNDSCHKLLLLLIHP